MAEAWDQQKDRQLLFNGYGRPDGYGTVAEEQLGMTREQGRRRARYLRRNFPDFWREVSLAAATPGFPPAEMTPAQEATYNARGDTRFKPLPPPEEG